MTERRIFFNLYLEGNLFVIGTIVHVIVNVYILVLYNSAKTRNTDLLINI